jgi:hypothetical protein
MLLHVPENGNKYGTVLFRVLVVSYVLLMWAVTAYVCDLLANGI